MKRNLILPFLLILIACLLIAWSSDKPTLHTIGDSTMAQKDTSNGNPERGWMMLFPEYLDTTAITVCNYAKNGRSSKSFRTEGLWAKTCANMKAGDYLFIQFGHNDQKADTARHTDPSTSFKANLVGYVREAKSKGVTPVLFTSIVRRSFDKNGTLIDTHGDYVKVVFDIAKEEGVAVVDLNKLTAEVVDSLGEEKSKQLYKLVPAGVLPAFPDGFSDNTHLNEQGARVVARLAVAGIMLTNCAIREHVLLK